VGRPAAPVEVVGGYWRAIRFPDDCFCCSGELNERWDTTGLHKRLVVWQWSSFLWCAAGDSEAGYVRRWGGLPGRSVA